MMYVLFHFQYKAPVKLTFANLAGSFFRKAPPLKTHQNIKPSLHLYISQTGPSASTKSPLSYNCQLLTACPLPTLTSIPHFVFISHGKYFSPPPGSSCPYSIMPASQHSPHYFVYPLLLPCSQSTISHEHIQGVPSLTLFCSSIFSTASGSYLVFLK